MERLVLSSYLKYASASSQDLREGERPDSGSDGANDQHPEAEREALTPEEVRGAAEAVVQAAAYRHLLEEDVQISPDTREFLIHAVSEEPGLTRLLFEQNLFKFQRC